MAGVAQQAPVLIKQMHRSRLCGCQSRNSRLVFVFAIIFLCGARSRALTATVTTSRGRGVAGLTLSRGSSQSMFYSGSVSPPASPPKKVRVVPRRVPAKKMGDAGSSSQGGVVKESS
jgi:hypothetical protein